MTALKIALWGEESRMMFIGPITGENPDQHGREDGEIFGYIVGDAEGGEPPPAS